MLNSSVSKKSQVSMEYLTIIGFVSVTSIFLIMIFYTYSDTAEDQIISNQLQKVSRKIVDTAESTYYLGEPSRTSLKAYFPNNIQNITIGNRELVFYVRTKNGIDEMVVLSKVDINGTLSQTPGIHNINIESQGDYVVITG